jgi:hypothetical protein
LGRRFQLIENKEEKNTPQTVSGRRRGCHPIPPEMRAITYAQDYPQALCAVFRHRYKPRTCRQLLRRVLSISTSAIRAAATFCRGECAFFAG